MGKWEQTRLLPGLRLSLREGLAGLVRLPQLRLLRQSYRADAPLNFEVNRHRRFSIEIVGLLVAVVLESVRADQRAESTASIDDDADVFREAYIGFSDAAFDVKAVRSDLRSPVRSTSTWPAPMSQIQPRNVNVAQAQIAAAGSHVDLDFERNVIGEMESPVVVGRRANVAVGIVLRNAKVACGSGDGVIHSGGTGRRAVLKIRFQKMARAAAQIKFACTHIQSGPDGLGIQTIDCVPDLMLAWRRRCRRASG